MYERFTDRARKVMQLANQEAQRVNHQQMDAFHILIGLIKEGSGIGARILKDHGLDLGTVRLEMEKHVPPGQDLVTMGRLPQTPLAKKVVEVAIQEAGGMQSGHIGTEHLLLGLLCVECPVTIKALSGRGLTLEGVRQKVQELTGQEGPDEPAKEETTPTEKKQLPLCELYRIRVSTLVMPTEPATFQPPQHYLRVLLRDGREECFPPTYTARVSTDEKIHFILNGEHVVAWFHTTEIVGVIYTQTAKGEYYDCRGSKTALGK